MAETDVKTDLTLEEFGSEEEFCEFVRDARQTDVEFDSRNRDRGVEDARFAGGYQWPAEEYRWRVDNNIPAMTFNLVPSLLRHRLGARARKRIGPKVTPVSVGKQYDGVALIREGIMRSIERHSDIASVDGVVSQNQLISGVGNYEVCVYEANNDVFDMDIFIKTDPNPWSVIWDNLSVDPTGRDSRRVIKETSISRKDFAKQFPNARAVDIGENLANTTSYPLNIRAGPEGIIGDWITEDTVRLAMVWTMHERERTLALMTNGETRDITGKNPKDVAIRDGAGGFHTVLIDPSSGKPRVRKSPVKYTKGTLTNGLEILQDPYELPCDRVPIVRVPGWMLMTGERMERYGLISFAKDALSFHNYVKSDRIERIVYRNRAQYEAQEDALSEEQENLYRNSHRLRGGVLKFRGPRPDQVLPPPVDQAAIIETEAAQRSIYDIFDIRPGLAGGSGQTPPSGVSLEYQMDITDSGGIIYDEMLLAAKREVYRVVDQIIPYTYDGPRVMKVIGEDGRVKDAILNDPENPESEDITIGKYSIDASTGPSAETQRQKAIGFYETMFNANPELMGLVAPELIDLLNIPGTDKLVAALRERSGVVDKDSPEAQAAMVKQQEMEQRVQQMAIQMEELKIAKLQADVLVKEAQAEASMAMAQSEKSQSLERIAKAEQAERMADARVAEMERRVQLVEAQTSKVLAEIAAMIGPNNGSEPPSGGRE